MRRRHDEATPPPELIFFDGRDIKTEPEWTAARDAFDAARERWAKRHGMTEDDMPMWKSLSDCPWNDDLI